MRGRDERDDAGEAPRDGDDDVARSLEQLEVLRAAGVVDDAEYAEQRARILASR